MKKNLGKRIIPYILTVALTATLLSGCSSNTDNKPEKRTRRETIDEDICKENKEETTESREEETTTSLTAQEILSGEGVDIMAVESILSGYASSSLNEDYNQPIYNLASDYVFEFECSSEAGYIAYDAFKVYGTSDLTGAYYNKNTYKDGKITVSPSGAVHLDENGSININDGTWGSLNQLYLVQYIDLETGKELERPIVTPFSIEHALTAPAINQGVDNNNSYMLTWEAVPGATEYRVYECLDAGSYVLECVTEEPFASVEQFISQQESEDYLELLMNDLKNAGYSDFITSMDGIFYMNRGVTYEGDFGGYFVVVAVDDNGNQSGISNVADVRELANRLPYTVSTSSLEVDIDSVEDIPAFVAVEMLDGSMQQMVIDYHGAQTYRYQDDAYKMSIEAHVANTLFNKFFITLHGMTYEDVMADISYVTAREDELLGKLTDIDEPQINNTPSVDVEVPTEPELPSETEVETETETPSETEPEISTEAPSETQPESTTEVQTEETTEAPEIVEDLSAPMQLMQEIKGIVENNISILGVDKIETVLYANNDLQAWMALCLISQTEIIPIPVEVYPDAANVDYAMSLLIEAYRQNPTSGMIKNMGYSSEYQALIVEYREDAIVRLEKSLEELDAAYSIALEVTDESMSDYEKVLAINEYFRENASYDFDSTATGVVADELYTEQYIDSHTPYGIICKNYGVCESYSEAFILTARFAGLEAVCETGAMYGGGHEWNRVKVDGSWCILDVTNNDADMAINALFNVTDSQVSGILAADNYAIMDYTSFAATDGSKEYYYVNGMSAEVFEDAADMLIEQLDNSKVAALRLPNNTTDEQLQSLIKELVQGEDIELTEAVVLFNVIYVEAQ